MTTNKSLDLFNKIDGRNKTNDLTVADKLQQALEQSRTGMGSYGYNYDGAVLGPIIERLIESERKLPTLNCLRVASFTSRHREVRMKIKSVKDHGVVVFLYEHDELYFVDNVRVLRELRKYAQKNNIDSDEALIGLEIQLYMDTSRSLTLQVAINKS